MSSPQTVFSTIMHVVNSSRIEDAPNISRNELEQLVGRVLQIKYQNRLFFLDLESTRTKPIY